MISLMAVVMLSACGGNKDAPQQSNQVLHANGPDWVNKGSGAFGGDKGKVFYGVGITSGTRNPALRRNMADTRARAEIAKIMTTYIAELDKSYQASTTAGDMSASSEEQHLQSTLKSYTQTDLSGVIIVDHWVDNDGTEYSLAQYDMATFGDSLNKMKDLNAKVRDAVRANADKAFDELQSEEAKHNQGPTN